jgi:hypothetical protein
MRETGAACGLLGEILPSHFKQASSAISAIEQVQEYKHDRTPLLNQCPQRCASTVSGRFRRQSKWFRRGGNWFRRNVSWGIGNKARLLKSLAGL